MSCEHLTSIIHIFQSIQILLSFLCNFKTKLHLWELIEIEKHIFQQFATHFITIFTCGPTVILFETKITLEIRLVTCTIFDSYDSFVISAVVAIRSYHSPFVDFFTACKSVSLKREYYL